MAGGHEKRKLGQDMKRNEDKLSFFESMLVSMHVYDTKLQQKFFLLQKTERITPPALHTNISSL